MTLVFALNFFTSLLEWSDALSQIITNRLSLIFKVLSLCLKAIMTNHRNEAELFEEDPSIPYSLCFENFTINDMLNFSTLTSKYSLTPSGS